MSAPRALSTPSERVSARQVARTGSSPFGREPLTAPDTSEVAPCTVDGCGRRFLNETFLVKHLTTAHGVKPKTATPESGAT